MILQQEITQFQKALEHELDAHDRMLTQWDTLDWHDRFVKLDYLLHRMWALYDKADVLSGYIRNNFPPYPFEEITEIKRWLKQALHRMEDFMSDDYMPVGTEDYQTEYAKWLSIICDDELREVWQSREAYIADKEKDLLKMLQRSYSVILELLLSTSRSIKNDPNVILLSYTNALVRYEQLQWNKDQISFEIRLANKYPWDGGPTARQLQDFYAALSDELIQTPCGKAYIHHRNDICKLVHTIAKQQPSEDEVLAFFRRTHELQYLQKRIDEMEVIEKQSIVKSIEPRLSSAKSKTVSPKQSPHFLDTPPLIYKYKGEAFSDTKRLTILFQYLCKEYEPTRTWIDPATSPDDFLSLFTGTNSSAVIIWTAPKQRLFGLFKRMKERKIITTPKGYGLWQIVQNHFSDWHGNMFQDFNKEHMPQEPVYSALETFIDILDPAITDPAGLDEYAKNIGRTFGKR